MARYHQNKKGQEKDIAVERIKELFKQADAVIKKNATLAKRYVTIARKISTRIKAPIPAGLKQQFCKKCSSYLKPGLNARIRLNNGKKTIVCLSCGNIKRVPYK